MVNDHDLKDLVLDAVENHVENRTDDFYVHGERGLLVDGQPVFIPERVLRNVFIELRSWNLCITSRQPGWLRILAGPTLTLHRYG